MSNIDQWMKVVLENPKILAAGAGGLIVLIILIVLMRGKKGAAAEAKQAGSGQKGANIASKEKLEQMGGQTPQKPGGAKLSSQTLDTKIGSSKPPAAKDPFKDEPDPKLVTQYQEGTGEGIEEIEARLKEDPNNEDLLDWLAFMYYSNNKLEKAIETYQKAINLNYENEHQHYYLGNAYYKLGKYDRAIEEWEVVVQLKPDSKLAQNAQERIQKVKTSGK
ncbi:MAG: tetratricopeptide repeat protein [Candidatus Riflebacteria bacterium]|nr:tetratricopeptide repeat protein [Candidatus Riflebacteria bacterium]